MCVHFTSLPQNKLVMCVSKTNIPWHHTHIIVCPKQIPKMQCPKKANSILRQSSPQKLTIYLSAIPNKQNANPSGPIAICNQATPTFKKRSWAPTRQAQRRRGDLLAPAVPMRTIALWWETDVSIPKEMREHPSWQHEMQVWPASLSEHYACSYQNSTAHQQGSPSATKELPVLKACLLFCLPL